MNKVTVAVKNHCISVRTPANNMLGYRSHVLIGTSTDLTSVHGGLMADLVRAESRGRAAYATVANLKGMIHFIQSLA